MHYYALVSSLPALLPESCQEMTVEKFLADCSTQIPSAEFQILKTLSLDPAEGQFPSGSFGARYMEWETSLRNGLVRARAAGQEKEPAKYLNRNAGIDSDAERAVSAAWLTDSPLEREQIIDRARWAKIEELERGFSFRFEQLCAYKLKLLINEKWKKRQEEKGAENLETATGLVMFPENQEKIQEI